MAAAASDAVTEEPVVPPAPPAEEYQNLADAITAAKDSYMTLLEAQKEVAATGLITEDTFKALEEAGYKFSEVLKDDVSGGLWVPADELKKFKELLDMGVITQEEFDAKKKQLLGL